MDTTFYASPTENFVYSREGRGGSLITNKIRSKIIQVNLPRLIASHESSGGKWGHLIVCPLRGQGSIPSCGREFQGVFPWLITYTWSGDGRHQVVTSPLKGYNEYEAIQLLLPSGPPMIKKVTCLKKIEKCSLCSGFFDSIILLNTRQISFILFMVG